MNQEIVKMSAEAKNIRSHSYILKCRDRKNMNQGSDGKTNKTIRRRLVFENSRSGVLELVMLCLPGGGGCGTESEARALPLVR